jgi:serine protease Do
MNKVREIFGRPLARTGAAMLAAIALVSGGAAWRQTADAAGAAVAAATQTAAAVPQVSRSAIGARDSYADVVKAVAPAVVTIRVSGRATPAVAQYQLPDNDFFRRFFGDPDEDNPRAPRQPRTYRQRGLGSGVIVTGDGYILTNNHVVEGADDIQVETTDGRTEAAKLIGTDKASDLAVIKIDGTNLHTLPLGNSDAVEVGDVVLAVGNPLGVGQTVTMGIISAKGRSTRSGSGGYEDFLQTDAPINQGNSGGALVSLKGELVGINSQILSGTGGNIGIGFAIPSNMAKHVMEELKAHGKVTRGQLGVTVQPVTSDIAQSLGLKDQSGALIGSVTPGSAADRAGLKRGDVIKEFNGARVTDTNTLRNRVADAGPGSTVQVKVVRDGSERTIDVKLDEAEPERVARNGSRAEPGDQSAALGVTVAPLTPELAARLRLPRDTRGVVVQDIDPDGRAADAGIEQGDVIQEVNRQAVEGVDQLRAAVRQSTDRPLLLLINREGSTLYVTVRPNNG